VLHQGTFEARYALPLQQRSAVPADLLRIASAMHYDVALHHASKVLQPINGQHMYPDFTIAATNAAAGGPCAACPIISTD
jgi:hypothetical protein